MKSMFAFDPNDSPSRGARFLYEGGFPLLFPRGTRKPWTPLGLLDLVASFQARYKISQGTTTGHEKSYFLCRAESSLDRGVEALSGLMSRSPFFQFFLVSTAVAIEVLVSS